MFKFTQVGICEGSVAQQVDYDNPNTVKQFIKGDLKVLLQINTGMLMFAMEGFQYGINRNDQIVYEDHNPDFKLILCLDADPKNCWFLKVNHNMELLFFCLSENCKLIQRQASKIIIREVQTAEESSTAQMQPQLARVNREEDEEKQSTESLLIEASKGLGEVLKMAGKLLSKGFQKLGNFLSTKVEPGEKVQISEQTKSLVQKSVDGSKKVLEFTAEQVANIFRMAKEETIVLVDKFEKSQKGKELQNKGEYSTIKQGLKTGIHVIANVYEGFSEGISSAGTGLAKGAAKVIGVKYGQDAAEVSLGVAQGAHNVAKFMRLPKDQAKKIILEKEKDK